jgi:hypothetical protein
MPEISTGHPHHERSSMDDRELLEAAAKAAGIESAGGLFWRRDTGDAWNPLTDDGDALRLAVKLGMSVNVENDIGAVCATAGWADGQLLPDGVGTEAFEGDPYAATRRAIVRAAAAMATSS